MSASFRSHFRHAPQQPEDHHDPRRKQESHRAIKADSKQGRTTEHVSKLTKRASRTVTPMENAEYDISSTRMGSTTVTVARNPASASRRVSVAPTSDPTPPGLPSGSTYHQGGLQLPHTARTPSLISGSSASTFDSPRSSGLRRKASSVDRWAPQKKMEDTIPTALDRATMHSRNGEYDDSVLGISLPRTAGLVGEPTSNAMRDASRPAEWPPATRATPPAPLYVQSTTPSTLYTDSPFSHVPTPSSASSYSSSAVATSGNATNLRQQSPTRTRLPTTSRSSDRNDTSRLGLPSVRESSTPSSNSTVKPTQLRHAVARKDVPRKTPSAPPSTKSFGQSKPPGQRQSSSVSSVKVSATKAPVQIPPELAHLNVDVPARSNLPRPLPPRRPSRDNTPSITDMSRPSPVVQSDLPHLYTTYHKRTPSQETQGSATSPSVRSRFGLSSKASSRQQSPRIDSAISPPPSARTFARGPTPEIPPAGPQRLNRTDSPAVGPAPSPSKSPRFGFFSRKPKPDVSKATERPKREPRKGPVAGTGHEGYARFGVRGRSGSSASSTGVRSPSTDSNVGSTPRPFASRKDSFGSSKDGSDLDDFLRERLNPVILRGSGSTTSNAASATDTHQPSVASSTSSSMVDSYPKPSLLPSAMQSDSSISLIEQPSATLRSVSDISRSDSSQGQPTLAARRSFNRLSRAESRSPDVFPAQVTVNAAEQQLPSVRNDHEPSLATSKHSTTLDMGVARDGGEGRWLQSPGTQTSAKVGRNWNFFQRAQASPRPKGKEKVISGNARSEVTNHAIPHRGVAHYAMMDPVEPVDLHELEQIMQEQETSTEESVSESLPAAKPVPYEQRHSSLLPSPPKAEFGKDADFVAKPTPPRLVVRRLSSESPVLLKARSALLQQTPHLVDIPRSPVTAQPSAPDTYVAALTDIPPLLTTPDISGGPFHTSSPNQSRESESPKHPRLSPVGRIPRVVSQRDRDRKLPDNSFSRPFQRTQPHPSVRPPGVLYNQIRELASPIEPSSQPVSSTSTRSDADQADGSHTNQSSLSTNRTSMDVHNTSDFLAFTPRKNSQVTYSSSSGGTSWAAVAIAPSLQTDDPWNEYNDLLDDMMPQKTPISAGSSLGAPFQYSTMLSDPRSSYMPTPLNYSQPPSMELPPPPRAATVPAVLSVPQQVARFMQPSMSPLSPHTLCDFVDSYGEWSTNTAIPSNQDDAPRQSRNIPTQARPMSIHNITRASLSSSRYSRASAHSRSASLPGTTPRLSQASLTPSVRFNRDTQLLDIAEDGPDEQASLANLRFGALMTSKWLSFGRVLFSPAHNEMRLADEPRVLVVDGLGSDWSYYVALSYPAATVYNLGPAPTNGSTSWPGINQKPPPNHKHIPHSSMSAAFPFPKGFFTAVVFRFPAVATEQAYHACVCECKRVLRPGGHLEVAVLDLDLMNMGSKARRVVRGLKTRLQQNDETVCLRNVSDVLVRMIGRRGFEQVQRCIVGVPAAGRIPRSQDISSTSSGHSNPRPGWRRETASRNDKEISFADLLEDARHSRVEPTHSNDEGITKMVAKVGRWWYSSCYETPSLGADASIWDDHALLRECEKQGTSFRLLICYAQKPMQTRRRTVSV